MNNNFPFVSFVIACLNEEKYISQCLNSILNQEYPKDKFEILVVDGMSQDGTRSILNKYASEYACIKIIDNPDKITPKAFNLGIKNSTGEIITIISAHADYDKTYISKCVEYLNKTGVDNVGGPMRAVGIDYISKAIAFVYNSSFGLGGGKFHDENWEGEAETVYPGCWRKEVFEKVGLFDERLVRNQDIEFDTRSRKKGIKIYLTPEIKTVYYCRSNLSGLWKQNFRNGFWNIKTMSINPQSLSVRHFVPLFFVLALLFGWAIKFLWFFVITSYVMCNLFFSLKIAVKNGMKYLFVIPAVFLVLHLSYGFGLMWGLMRYVKRNDADEGRSNKL